MHDRTPFVLPEWAERQKDGHDLEVGEIPPAARHTWKKGSQSTGSLQGQRPLQTLLPTTADVADHLLHRCQL